MTNIYPIHAVYLLSLSLERLLLCNQTANPFLDLTFVFFAEGSASDWELGCVIIKIWEFFAVNRTLATKFGFGSVRFE